jgi:hypothetical protein
MNGAGVLLWGLAATVVQSILLTGAQAIGLSRMSLPFILGTVFTANRDLAAIIGLVVHVALGWLIAFVYAAIFESLGRANPWLGGLIGLCHGLFVLLVLLPVLPGAHPRMASEHSGPDPTPALEPPGFLALNYGRWTPAVTLIAHVAYGTILGAFYLPVG